MHNGTSYPYTNTSFANTVMQNKSEKWFPKVVTNREIFFYLFFFKKSQVNVCGGNFPFPIFYLYFLNQVNVFAGNFPFFLSFFFFFSFFLFWHRKQAGCGFNACLLRPAGWLLIRIQESLLSVCVDTEISLPTAYMPAAHSTLFK